MQSKILSILIVIFVSFGLSACLPFSVFKDKPLARKNARKNSSSKKQASKIGGPITVDVGPTDQYVNVMGDEMPDIPDFDELSPKPGTVRGYVKDAAGNPLEGAAIGLRLSYFAGSYSGAQGVTDSDGYYEIKLPEGSGNFYNAGYQVEWGGGLAALGLHPADGKLESFTSYDGAVENFVLLPYGITSRENLSQYAYLASTYYGATMYVGYWYQAKDDNNPSPGGVIEDSVAEITLTPDGEMLDGVEPRPIIIRKTIGNQSGFNIHNIPPGRYKLKVTMDDGTRLKIKQGRQTNPLYGMTPNETSGDEEATILFAPKEAKASMVSPQQGAWEGVSITLESQ